MQLNIKQQPVHATEEELTEAVKAASVYARQQPKKAKGIGTRKEILTLIKRSIRYCTKCGVHLEMHLCNAQSNNLSSVLALCTVVVRGSLSQMHFVQ